MTTVKLLWRLISFTAAASCASASKPMSGSCYRPRFEGVGEVDAGALLGAEAVAGLGELEADFHVGDGVGGHHQLEGVEARE